MKYQVESTRPSLKTILFLFIMICIVLPFVYFISILFSGLIVYFFMFGLFCFIFAFAYNLYKYLTRNIPSEFETSKQNLIIKYENGKTESIPYTDLRSCIVAKLGTQVLPTASNQLTLFGKRNRVFKILDAELAEKICGDINSRLPTQ